MLNKVFILCEKCIQAMNGHRSEWRRISHTVGYACVGVNLFVKHIEEKVRERAKIHCNFYE